MAWISPTGHNDPGNEWSNETSAYDDNVNLAASAYKEEEEDTWTSFLELTHAALNCDKVRFRLATTDSDEMDLDVYYDGGWHDVYQGLWVYDNTWYEKSIPAGIKSVTKMRIRLLCPTTDEWDGEIKEVDFNEVPAGIARPLVGGSLASGSLVGKGLAR